MFPEKVFISILLVAIPIFASAQLPTSGLVAWYPFCGNANDYSGNGRDLTVVGPTLTTDRFGSINCAYYFNGSTSGVNNTLHRMPPMPTDATDYTYSCWFEPDVDGNMQIVANGDCDIVGYELTIIGSTCCASIGNNLAIVFGGINMYLPTPVALNQWHHAAMRRTVNSFDLFIDTVLVGSFTGTFYPTSLGQDFAVGENYLSGSNSFQGKIDDIAIYNRALSDSEIRQLYHYDPVCAAIPPIACDSISLPDTLHTCFEIPVTLSATLYGADSVLSIQWTPTTGLSDPAILDPIFSAPGPGWYYLTVQSLIPGNLVVNGNFTAGNTGFTSGYTYNPTAPPPGTASIPGEYDLTTNPYLYNTAWPSMGDHTTGTGNMLAIDASTTAGVSFWCETIAVTPNTNYVFSVWSALFYPPLPSIQITINGIAVDTFTTTAISAEWMQNHVTWNSGIATSANICMTDLNTTAYGNDFAIDDISFQQLCTGKDSVYIDMTTPGTTYGHSDTSFCSLVAGMVLNAPAGYSSYLWNTGATTPSVTAGIGIYWVDASISCASFIDTFHVVSVHPTITSLVNDTFVCAGNSITLNAPAGYSSYLWNTGSVANSVTEGSGIYWVSASIICAIAYDTFYMTAIPLPIVSLGSDTAICEGSSVTLTSFQETSSQYLWSNGSTNASIAVSAAGTYSLTVTQNGCSASSSVNVSELNTPPAIDLGPDTLLCTGDQFILSVNDPTGSLLWSTGATKQTITVTDQGNYWVIASNICGSVSDTVNVNFELCDIWFPSAFTPNDDGLNDIIRVVGNLQHYNDFSLSICNRWGQRVFYTEDIYSGWNGKFNGVNQDVGSYYYMIFYSLEGKRHMMKGDLELIR